MKVILIFVTTLDGKITKWGDPHVMRWSSAEDQKYFKKTWSESPLIIMGSTTFNADPITPPTGQLLTIMTQYPSQYKKYETKGRLEFTSESPRELIARFGKGDYKQMLVVGGPHVATSFLEEQLIDELWLTIEPKIFGAGGNFVIDKKLDINLRLLSCEQVNENGTLMTKYRVIKNTA